MALSQEYKQQLDRVTPNALPSTYQWKEHYPRDEWRISRFISSTNLEGFGQS